MGEVEVRGGCIGSDCSYRICSKPSLFCLYVLCQYPLRSIVLYPSLVAVPPPQPALKNIFITNPANVHGFSILYLAMFRF